MQLSLLEHTAVKIENLKEGDRFTGKLASDIVYEVMEQFYDDPAETKARRTTNYLKMVFIAHGMDVFKQL